MVRNANSVCRQMAAVAVLLFAFAPAPNASGAYDPDNAKTDTPKPGEPTDAKARKTYASAVDWEKHRDYTLAIENFRKANKQDGGNCTECLKRAYKLATQIGEYKDAESIARDMLTQAGNDTDKAAAHFRLAAALQRQGVDNKKEKCFTESCDEFKTSLQLEPRLVGSHYYIGVSLAYLHQDDAARAEFTSFLQSDHENPDMRERAQRFLEHVDLARATMAPPFSVKTLDGQQISMDGLAGKVVLIDFWATWCGPCREALPHIRQIARKFAGQPLVVLSISLDDDDAKWRDFVGKNGMTWLQYRAGGFGGTIPKQFNVNAIPATFTIDADGVLEDQHVGDADIEGKLKKLIARAVEVNNRKAAPVVAEKAPAGAD